MCKLEFECMAYDTPYRFTLEEDDHPSTRLIQAIASITNAGHGELNPLHDVIDPEALNNLIHTGDTSVVSFEYEGFHVTVHGEGEIILRNPESIHTKLNDPSNVLLVAPRGDDGDLCDDLQQPYPIDQENILDVTVDRSAEAKLNDWGLQRNKMPAEHKIISLGDFARSADTKTVTLPGSIKADLIADERDLATLQERINSTLSEWQSNPYKTALCFDSVNALVAATGLDTAFSFFYDLVPQVADSDTVAHYHLDPLQCDSIVVSTLSPLFDSVVYEDGEHTDSHLG